MDKIKKELVSLGYERNVQVETVGQFAIRGGILDIFPTSSECPYRIELFGDEIDGIRSFDVDSQRSIENINELDVYPAAEMILDDNRIEDGMKKISKEHKAFAKKLKSEFKTESYARINRQVEGLKEELQNFHGTMGVDSYIEYFYDELNSFFDYMPKDTLFFVDGPEQVEDRAKAC